MANATRVYSTAANSSGMKGGVTAASDTTDLGAGVEVKVFVAKTATNKAGVLRAIEAIMQKITEETSP